MRDDNQSLSRRLRGSIMDLKEFHEYFDVSLGERTDMQTRALIHAASTAVSKRVRTELVRVEGEPFLRVSLKPDHVIEQTVSEIKIMS